MLGSGSFAPHPTADPPYSKIAHESLPAVQNWAQHNESQDLRKKTSVNFRKHTLSLQQARQNEPKQKLSLGKPLIQAEKFKLLANEREVDGRGNWGHGSDGGAKEEEENDGVEEVMLVRRKGRQDEEYKLVPLNFRASRRGPFRQSTEETPRNNSRKLV